MWWSQNSKKLMTVLTSLRNIKTWSIQQSFYGTSKVRGSQLKLYLTFYADWLHCTGTQTVHPAWRGKPQTIQYTPWCTLEAFLDLRDNPKTYEVFFTEFIPAIGRKTYWKHMVANAETDDDITTISNEAFVLLVLENNWDRWMEIYRMNDGTILPSKGRGKRHSDCTILSKYT